jgi:purine-binding chemotaxis protein CheW
MSLSELSELNQYLTFTLKDELFAIDIAWVKEILDDKNITAIPMLPECLRGVINVRGKAVPVVDLRLSFNMTRTEMTVNTCVIICELELDAEITAVGFLADSVQEVVELHPDQIDPPPRMGTRIDARRIRGMGKREGKFIIILDMGQILSDEDVGALQTATDEIAA